jgi:tRNA-Thr(GGU) m(6)t(6)A37 methyltransferase TsaA
MSISFSPIGHFRTPYTDVAGMPIQPVGGYDTDGCIEVLPAFTDGLQDLDGFSNVIVLYHLHRITGYDLIVKPFLDVETHGIFATRSPKRPNPIGLSIMRLKKVEGCVVHLQGIDVLDGTPVIDIKPYVADFDQCNADRFGWFEGKSTNARHQQSDARFAAD